MIPSAHLRGQGCPVCGLERKTKRKEQFIQEAKDKYNNFYDYSKVEYVNNITKVCIICSKHR